MREGGVEDKEIQKVTRMGQTGQVLVFMFVSSSVFVLYYQLDDTKNEQI